MLPTSLAVVLATVGMTLVPALVLFWAWRRGFFRDLDAQSRVIFEERDWRLERPWESGPVRLAREMQFGETLTPAPGEWGDGAGASGAPRREPGAAA